MERAVVSAGRSEPAYVQEQNFRRLRSHNVAKEFLPRVESIILSENLPSADMAEYVAVTPIKISNDIDATRFYEPNLADSLSRAHDDFVFFEFSLLRAEAGKQGVDFFFVNPMK